MSNPFLTTAPRPLQPMSESLIKILSLISSAVTVDGKLRVSLPGGGGAEWGELTGDITDQLDLTGYVQTQISAALSTVVEKKGGIDCSANPNFPAASNCDLYFVTHAGKIGGPSGQGVSIGDTMIAIADTAAGDQAAVGANWIVLNTNIPGLSTLGVVFATMLTPAGPRYLRVNSDGTISSLTDVDLKSSIGLGNVDNTSDANKPVSTAQAAAIAAVNKSSIGLGNVDNTSDVNKPVSTAQAVALALKQDTLPTGAALQVLRRNATNTALEFAAPAAGGSSGVDIQDVWASISQI